MIKTPWQTSWWTMAPSSWPSIIIQKTLCSCRVLRIVGMIVNNLCSFWHSSCTHDIIQCSRRLPTKHPWPRLVNCASLRSFITRPSSKRTSASSATRCYSGGRRAHRPMALRIWRSWQVPFICGTSSSSYSRAHTWLAWLWSFCPSSPIRQLVSTYSPN